MSSPELASDLQSSLDEHSNKVKLLIIEKAAYLAEQEEPYKDQKSEVTIIHLAKAIELYSPGYEIVQ